MFIVTLLASPDRADLDGATVEALREGVARLLAADERVCVALGEVNPRTMESRRHPGLYLCGEVLDAFGPIGGYNFLWAWATGRAAGLGAAG